MLVRALDTQAGSGLVGAIRCRYHVAPHGRGCLSMAGGTAYLHAQRWMCKP